MPRYKIIIWGEEAPGFVGRARDADARAGYDNWSGSAGFNPNFRAANTYAIVGR